ncbi:biotin/lipoyl-containing protein, partial [Ralstonia pseudosolanacearum]
VGEAVKRDEVLADIETDKVVLEVVAPADGALAEITAEEGSQVESEAVLAIFAEGAGDEGATAADKAPEASADDGAGDE